MKTIAIINMCVILLCLNLISHSAQKHKSVLDKGQIMINSILLCFYSFQMFLWHHEFENKNYQSLTG
jgi:hypothetical protein